MKVTVVGGTGLIGSQVVQELTAAGHQAVPAAPSTGVDLITGKGLDELGRITLAARHDDRTVVTDDKAGMFAPVTGDVLTAGANAHLAATHYQDWLQPAR